MKTNRPMVPHDIERMCQKCGTQAKHAIHTGKWVACWVCGAHYEWEVYFTLKNTPAHVQLGDFLEDNIEHLKRWKAVCEIAPLLTKPLIGRKKYPLKDLVS